MEEPNSHSLDQVEQFVRSLDRQQKQRLGQGQGSQMQQSSRLGCRNGHQDFQHPRCRLGVPSEHDF